MGWTHCSFIASRFNDVLYSAQETAETSLLFDFFFLLSSVLYSAQETGETTLEAFRSLLEDAGFQQILKNDMCLA